MIQHIQSGEIMNNASFYLFNDAYFNVHSKSPNASPYPDTARIDDGASKQC